MKDDVEFAALRFLAEKDRCFFDERRKIESQVFLASLGFYVVTVGAGYAKDLWPGVEK